MKINKIASVILIAIMISTYQIANAIEETNKKAKKEKEDYSKYLIPTESQMPEGMSEDTITIEGGVSKSLELNLADCLELALQYNPKIKASYAQARAIKTHRGQTLSNYSPRVNLSTGISRIKPDMSSSGLAFMERDPFNRYLIGTIGVKQLIYDFGITQNTYTINKLEYENSLQNIENTVNDVIYKVKDSYYHLITSIEKRKVMEDTVQKYQETYNQALAFYEVGTKPKIDVTIAQTNLADAKAKLIETKNEEEIAISRLNNAIGLPFIVPYDIEENLPFETLNLSMNEIIDIANNNRPALKSAILSIKTAEQQIKLAKKVMLPKLEFQGNWGAAKNPDIETKNFWNLGGVLEFPLINPLLIKNQIDEAKSLLEKQQFDSQGTLNDVYYDIQNAWARLNNAQEKVPVALLAQKKSEENYELANGRYKVGVSDAIELKDAQIQYQNARLNYYQSLYEYNSAKADLERAIGQTLKSEEKTEENASTSNMAPIPRV